MKKLMLGLIILTLSSLTFGVMNAYNSYDTQTAPWLYTKDTKFVYSELPNSESFALVTSDSYPAGNPAFGNALDIKSPAAVLIYTDDETQGAINNTLNPVEGTIEMWINPHWFGKNQGGEGAGCAVGTSQSLFQLGATDIYGPLNLIIFNNNYPNDGGQLFLSWNDGVDFWNINNSAVEPAPYGTIYGTTYDWMENQWHHVAVSWDKATVGLYLDGGVVREENRTNINKEMFGNGAYLFGKLTASGHINTFNGMVDDVTISDHAKYTPGAGGYVMPTYPAPEPGVFALLSISGLTLLRKKSDST